MDQPPMSRQGVAEGDRVKYDGDYMYVADVERDGKPPRVSKYYNGLTVAN